MTDLVALCIGKKGRWITLSIWLIAVLFVSILFPNAQKLANNSASDLKATNPSVQAEKMSKTYFPKNDGTPLLIVWYRSSGLKTSDFQKVNKLYQQLDASPLAQQASLPPYSKMPVQALQTSVSKDGTTLVTPVMMNASASGEELTADLRTLKRELVKENSNGLFTQNLKTDGLHIRFTGPASIASDAVQLFKQADVTLLLATVFLVLVLLLIIYRSPILALIPLIGVGFAYGLVGPILGYLAKSGVITVDSQGLSIMTVLLFGAGTDYCLFLVSRFRETLLEEEDKFKALRAAIDHSGIAILISAITVALSLSTLLLAGYGSIHRFAIPFSLSILAMGLAALTFLPALLSVLGRASFFPFIPRTEAMQRRRGKQVVRTVAQQKHGRISQWVGPFVVRRPWTVILVTAIILGSLALTATRITTTQNLLASFPKQMMSREGFSVIASHFSKGDVAPVQLIVNTQGRTIDLKRALKTVEGIATVGTPMRSSVNSSIMSVSLTLKGDPFSNKTIDQIPRLEKDVRHALTKQGIADTARIAISGQTATLYDTMQVTRHDTQQIVLAVILVIACLLLLYLRSIIAALYLMVTVMLSYVAALGAGWFVLHDVLGATALNSLIPLYAFVFLVALGEDYNIFMVSSIWQNRKRLPLKQAIALGVTETGTVITSAGLILAGTFAVLATLPIQVLLQFGIVMAVGVLLDTFIVRPLLVPALTAVLGRYAYWPGKLWRKKELQQDSLTQS
ncbi:MAG: MMPL family transporter [Sporolactobacillus sp.]